MFDGIITKLGFQKAAKSQPLGEASRVKKDYELAPKTSDKLVRSPKTDTFTSSNSAKEKSAAEKK